MKCMASKRARRDDAPPIVELCFKNDKHKTRYMLLARKLFGMVRHIDWDILIALGLDEVILEHISHDGLDKMFNIMESTCFKLTVEVLSTIKVVRHYNFV